VVLAVQVAKRMLPPRLPLPPLQQLLLLRQGMVFLLLLLLVLVLVLLQLALPSIQIPVQEVEMRLPLAPALAPLLALLGLQITIMLRLWPR